MIVSEFTTIKHLRAKYHNQHGIIATLTGMFQGSINIQQIAAKLLAPFKEHWNPRKKYFRSSMNIIALLNFLHINLKKKNLRYYIFFSIATTHVSSASEARASSKTANPVVFRRSNVY